MAAILIISILGVIGLYYFYIAFFSNTIKIERLLKLTFIFSVIGIALAVFLWYLTEEQLPASFKEGVEILTGKAELTKKIGTYQSYSFKKSELPKTTDNPAIFKVSLNGTAATIYLTCKMEKGTSGKWFLRNVKEDSLKVK